jgi:anti-sigma regulatory factor (Ser/Thr protein kinase)
VAPALAPGGPRRYGQRVVPFTPPEPFAHEVLLYDGPRDLLSRTLPFIVEGVRAGEPVMVAVTPPKLAALRSALGDDAAEVAFVDMAELGRNPARIIPAWEAFAREHHAAGRAVRGIGEPVWGGRTSEELIECQLHEALLNVAFAGRGPFRLMCPYDRTALDPAVIREACCSHPVVVDDTGRAPSREFRRDELTAPFETPLSRPPASTQALSFDRRTLDVVRGFTARRAEEAGLGAARAGDLVLAVNEIATNSIRHAGGHGVLRAWREDHELVCEVRDPGRIEDPLAGRHIPAVDQLGGRGIWIANRLCDLVQLRSLPEGTVVRLRMTVG